MMGAKLEPLGLAPGVSVHREPLEHPPHHRPMKLTFPMVVFHSQTPEATLSLAQGTLGSAELARAKSLRAVL